MASVKELQDSDDDFLASERIAKSSVFTCKSKSSWHDGKIVNVLLVAIAFFLDNLLQASIVPILPAIVHKTLNQSIANTSGTLAQRHNGSRSMEFFADEVHSQVGLLHLLKPLVQFLLYPVVGPAIVRFGSSILFIIGLGILAVVSTVYGIMNQMVVLYMTRALQGLGSAFLGTAGLALISQKCDGDVERTRSISWALNGLAAGYLIGYPYGGLAYSFLGHYATFIIVSGFFVSLCGISVWHLKSSVTMKIKERQLQPCHLLQDKGIMISTFLICIMVVGVAAQETVEPIWMKMTMNAEEWQIGLIFMPDQIFYLLTIIVVSYLIARIPRWILPYTGFIIGGGCAVAIPFCTNEVQLIGPHFGFGIIQGMVEAPLISLVGLLVELQHNKMYGHIYCISEAAISLGYITGPAIAGNLVNTVGFKWIMWGVGFLYLSVSPLCLQLRIIELKPNMGRLQLARQLGKFSIHHHHLLSSVCIIDNCMPAFKHNSDSLSVRRSSCPTSLLSAEKAEQRYKNSLRLRHSL